MVTSAAIEVPGATEGMTMWESPEALEVSSEARRTLEGWVDAHTSPQRIVMRARIVLLASQGMANRRIAREVGTSRPTVLLWRDRFVAGGVAALLEDAPGRGRPASITAAKVKRLVKATTQTRPRGATHWSTRTMAEAQGISHATVQRIWDAHGLQPHRVKTFKLSRDKRFVEKLTDVVGVYLNPPDKAVILCVDEKSQIQALDRTQPGLPLKKGRCGTMTHDYKRNGTTTLFAALNTLEGTVIGTCYPRHRNIEFRKFLRQIDQSIPPGLDIHMILDNYGTHKHPHVQSWLARHQRFHLHFTPTSSSWLNLVERWFRELTDKRIRRGSFSSVPELIVAIQEFITANNDTPKPFVWTASVEKILEKISHCKAIFETLH
jgi:transposase